MPEPGERRTRRIAIVLALLSGGLALAYSLGLVWDRPNWLRGVGWAWGRFMPDPPAVRLALLAALGLAWLAVVLLTARRPGPWRRRRTGLLLLWAALLTPAAALTIAAQHRAQPLSVAFLSATLPKIGFYYDGLRLSDPGDFIRQHPDRMPDYDGVHERTQPFGWQLAYWAAGQLWQQVPSLAQRVGQWFLRYDCTAYNFHEFTRAQVAAASLQMSLVFLTGLGVIPLYGLGRRLFSAETARLAVALYPLLPGFLVFQAYIDVAYALVALWAVWLAFRWLTRLRAWGSLAAMALLLAGATLFSLGALIFVVLVGGLTLAYVALEQPTRAAARRWLVLNGAILTALTALWLTVWLVWGVSGWEIMRIGRTIHTDIRITYPVWPLFNLYDVGVFMGLPWLVWALTGGAGAAARVLRQQRQPGDSWLLGWPAFLLVLSATGEVRAETGRIWLFVAPLGLLGAAASVLRLTGRGWLLAGLCTTFGVQALMTGFYLGGPPRGAAAPERTTTRPDSAELFTYQLGAPIALQGYHLATQPEGVNLTLYWRALTWVYADYTGFVHLRAADGHLISQTDGPLAEGRLPTWCWTPGEVVADPHFLPWGEEGPQSADLSLGLYTLPDGVRLSVTPFTPDNAITIPVK